MSLMDFLYPRRGRRTPAKPRPQFDHTGVHYTVISPFDNHILILVDTLDAQNRVLDSIGLSHESVVYVGAGHNALSTQIEHARSGKWIYIVSFDAVAWKRYSFPRRAGLAAHEVTHVIDWVLAAIEEKHPGMETRAYLTQSLTQFVLTHLWTG